MATRSHMGKHEKELEESRKKEKRETQDCDIDECNQVLFLEKL